MKRCRHVHFAAIALRIKAGILIRKFKVSIALCALLGCLQACTRAEKKIAPVTIKLLDPGWLDKEFLARRSQEEVEFTRETGILVKDFPAPETAIDQLALWRKLLENSADAPDVFAIDVIWPAMMAQYALDLSPYRSDTAEDFPSLVANDTVNGRLVAMPYHADMGLLFYRSDLLRAYGYQAPPATWDELETMAAQIQKGERAKGNKDFWGFVWEGAASEALTCNALEWQASEGGGRIIEPDGKISVNNPRAIRSWERAAHWIGSISPPSVIAYREWDALNIWRSGNAAFMRNWPTSYLSSGTQESSVRGKFGVAILPGGQGGGTGTQGGASLSVFRNTAHPAEAVALVRFFCRRDVELKRSLVTSQPPVMPDLFDEPNVLKAMPYFASLKQMFNGNVTTRPSTITGSKYAQVSAAYFTAVHAVLARQKSGANAAADLEKDLIRITGLEARAVSSKHPVRKPPAGGSFEN